MGHALKVSNIILSSIARDYNNTKEKNYPLQCKKDSPEL